MSIIQQNIQIAIDLKDIKKFSGPFSKYDFI